MLCEANVSLSDWPQGQRRDVDPTNERVKGLLRSGFIVPLMLRRPPVTPPKLAEGDAGDNPAEPTESPEAPKGASEARRTQRKRDE